MENNGNWGERERVGMRHIPNAKPLFFHLSYTHTRTHSLDKWSFLPSRMYVSEWKTNSNNSNLHTAREFEQQKERVERRTMQPATWHVRLHQYVWLYTESLFLPIFFCSAFLSLSLTRMCCLLVCVPVFCVRPYVFIVLQFSMSICLVRL